MASSPPPLDQQHANNDYAEKQSANKSWKYFCMTLGSIPQPTARNNLVRMGDVCDDLLNSLLPLSTVRQRQPGVAPENVEKDFVYHQLFFFLSRF